MSDSSDSNHKIKTFADYAVKAAKERFGRNLDYTEDSLQQLEALLEQAYKRFSELSKQGSTAEKSIQLTTKIWGSYLGEFIRHKFGGSWQRQDVDYFIVINHVHLTPYSFVRQRITSNPNYSAVQYYKEVTSGLTASHNETPNASQQLSDLENTRQGLRNETSKEPKKSILQGIPSNTFIWIWIFFIFCVFFGVSYVFGMLLFRDTDNPFVTGICLSIMIVIVLVWIGYSKNRAKTVEKAISSQKEQTPSVYSESPNRYTGTPQNYSGMVSCRTCGHTVARTAPVCPNCGDTYPGLIAKCPHCGSKNIRITQKGFSLGKAATGAILAGPIGMAGGLHGRSDLKLECSNCHRILTIKSYEI
jgi:hypothetical protein